jgi:hypothetical protein
VKDLGLQMLVFVHYRCRPIVVGGAASYIYFGLLNTNNGEKSSYKNGKVAKRELKKALKQ